MLLVDQQFDTASPSSANIAFLESGSVTGYRSRIEPLGYSYLENSRPISGLSSSSSPSSVLFNSLLSENAPFCSNLEGWGPMSPFRYDFTPCFVDIWLLMAAAFGILFGGFALVRLVKKPQLFYPAKSFFFWLKQTLLLGLIASFGVQLGFQLVSLVHWGQLDVRHTTTILTIVSLGVIFAIQWAEYTRLRVPHDVDLIYWVFIMLAMVVKFRSLITQQVYATDKGYFISYAISSALTIVSFMLEEFSPRTRTPTAAYSAILDEDEEEEEQSPLAYADVFSRLTFSWMNPMIVTGSKKFLTHSDLYPLVRADHTKVSTQRFEKAWKRGLSQKKPSGIWTALFAAHGAAFFLSGLFKFLNDVPQATMPLLLKGLINFIDRYNSPIPEPAIKGVVIAFSILGLTIFQTLMANTYFYLSMVVSYRVKSALMSAVYNKALNLSNEGRKNQSSGTVVNLMAVDAEKVMMAVQLAHQLWSAPFQVAMVMTLLYRMLGWPVIAGVGVMVVMVPLNTVITQYLRKLQKEQMSYKDKRSHLLEEIINNMKSIKLYAWSPAFLKRLSFVRENQELHALKKLGFAQSASGYIWTSAPFFVSSLTFMLFALSEDTPLSVEVVFPALALFNLLSFPLGAYPIVITSVTEALVACRRIQDFLLADELQKDAVVLLPTKRGLGEDTVTIQNGYFSWDRHEDRTVLKNINFKAYKGELSCIVGRVGMGKSSFLQSILGDLYKSQGYVSLSGSVAYVAQQPWVLNASLKENILFGHRYEPDFYQETLRACCLLEDLAQLPDGDNTFIGERGISLSGGQRARVALARAVYARADVYLLDDVLSAVDSHVGKRILNDVLGPRGILHTKTRILATNAIYVLKNASYISLIQNGEIVEKGTYKEISEREGLVADLLRTAGQGHTSGSSSPSTEDGENSSGSSSVLASPSLEDGPSQSDGQQQQLDEAVSSASSQVAPIVDFPASDVAAAGTGVGAMGKPRQGSTCTIRRASIASHRQQGSRALADEEEANSRTSEREEHRERGRVKWSVYLEYFRTANIYTMLLYLIVLFSAQFFNFGAAIWLKYWSEANQKLGRNGDALWFLAIYFSLTMLSCILTSLHLLIIYIYCGLTAAKKLHKRMADAIFRAPMSFFDITPTGRILNRFTSDIDKLDVMLPRNFNMMMNSVAKALFTLLLVSVATPLFSVVVVPCVYLFYRIQQYYLLSSRELQRLNSISRSPIYEHFQESLGGLSTIRAFRQQKRFAKESEDRIDHNLQAYQPMASSNRWLGLRLEVLGGFLIFAAAGLSVIAVLLGQEVSAGMVGVSMSYALSIMTTLTWIMRQLAEVESNIVAVERILEYSSIPSEAPDVVAEHRPAPSWPEHGAVEFVNYSARYREGLDLVLHNINLDIKPREKIGVVGRTGAGKSSLTLALFRLIESAEGNINIDNVDTSEIGLLDLRRRLAIIPQDAALFEGTLRDNLDPGHVYDDAELWSVLEYSRLREHVEKMDGQLLAQIAERGGNLSQGQRQLVSLARAMLTPSNILVLDEATAAVDIETDSLLQETLRSSMFSNRTIITVAHRINTILDSDRIVVLDKGHVAEFDTPQALLEKKGMFWALAKEAGLAE